MQVQEVFYNYWPQRKICSKQKGNSKSIYDELTPEVRKLKSPEEI